MTTTIVFSILFGLVAAKANFLAISMLVALFAGVFLLTRPTWIVWIILSMGLLLVGVAPLFDSALESKAGWPISILCFILMLLAFFKTATTEYTQKHTPAFIWLLLCFFAYAIFNSLVQWSSEEEFVGGFKRYFQMWGISFALCWLAFDNRYIGDWRVFFLIVALAQLPFAIYELVALVPVRQALSATIPGGLVAVDVIAGTFGATIYGGGCSGEMATFLIIILAFLLAQRMEKVITVGRFFLLTPWVLAPLFLGETRVVIVMLPIMFIVLYRRELLSRPHYGLMALMVGVLLTVSLGYAYLSITHMSLDKLFTDTLSYNLYETGYGTNYLNRTTVLTFWIEQQGAHDPLSFVFGNGLGSSHQQTRGHVDIRYPGYGIGLTAASTLLWDTGVFGFGLFVGIFALAWHTANRLYCQSTEPTVRADAIAIQASLSLLAFHLFYNLALLEIITLQIVFSAVLGYLAWLYRKHAASIAWSRP